MKYQAVAFASSALLGLAVAGPQHRQHAKREVPQEHSHETFLRITTEFLAKDNPKSIVNPVFGLLGDTAAAQGAGKVTNLACLQQETADQAFTNAKAVKDIRGMSGALVYATLERNTAGVGKASAPCTDKAVNPEIAAVVNKHQDPASDGAAATNKAVTLELAKQLASVGGDPMLALLSGTFAPGDKADTTGAGKSCDDKADPVGCIFTGKKLVLDATPDEITAAVKGVTPTITGGTGELKAADIADVTSFSVAGGGAAPPSGTAGKDNAQGSKSKAVDNGSKSKAVDDSSKTKDAACKAADNGAVKNKATNGTADATADGTNVQTFTGSLGGAPPPVIESSDSTNKRPFSVKGDTFVGKGAALGRSCDVQHNACATAANSGKLDGGVAACDAQNAECRAQAGLNKRQAGKNVQTFTGSLGGTPPPVIESSGTRPFSVNGDTFVGKGAALGRSCDVQHTACSRAANSGQLAGGVAACDAQNIKCHVQAGLKKRQAGKNIQTFTGSLGGTPPPVIESSDSTNKRPFSVKGDTFVGKGAALGRSCDVQHNACATAANSGKLDGGVAACDAQNAECRSQAGLNKRFFRRQATDFGSCSDPSVEFKSGLADRQDAAFIATNQKDFAHGSAQKIGIIAGFICQRLQDSCKAPAATIDACKQAQTAATAAKQDETAATVFNSMLIGGGGGGGSSGGGGSGSAASATCT